MDSILNGLFFVFHTAWIAFNCVGWIWRRTRPWQLAAVSLTALSWFGLGVWYGWGYCPCTDWHWQVRARLGHEDPPSYIQLLVREVTGIDLSPAFADTLAVVTLAVVSLLSAVPEKELVRYLTRLGPVGLILHEADDRTRARVIETVRAAFEPYVHGAEVRFTAACWMVGARAGRLSAPKELASV